MTIFRTWLWATLAAVIGACLLVFAAGCPLGQPPLQAAGNVPLTVYDYGPVCVYAALPNRSDVPVALVAVTKSSMGVAASGWCPNTAR